MWAFSVVSKPKRVEFRAPSGRIVASLDRKRLGADFWGGVGISIRGVFDKETRKKPLAFAADAVRYGI
jgi:hypothetical protein